MKGLIIATSARLTRQTRSNRIKARHTPLQAKKQHIKRNPQTKRGDISQMRARASPKKSGGNPIKGYTDKPL